eukprot:1685963-Prymnesium_polylepis.2
MSAGFIQLATQETSTLSDSEGEWVPPPSDLSLLGLPQSTRLLEPASDGGDSEAEPDPDVMAAAD